MIFESFSSSSGVQRGMIEALRDTAGDLTAGDLARAGDLEARRAEGGIFYAEL